MLNNNPLATQELNDNLLEQVQGGAVGVDWQLFATKFMEYLDPSNLKPEYVELLSAIKQKDLLLIQKTAIPLIATHPDLMRIAMECMEA